MQSQVNIRTLVGGPVGVSFLDGTGTSGVLCDIEGNELYLQEYMYQDFFALKHYDLSRVGGVYPFPECQTQPGPTPYPYPIVY